MNCDDADSSAKWTCKKCTYDNFQKSIKCTICLTPNHNIKYIIDEIKDESTSVNDLTNSSHNDPNEKKWNCLACTYRNWPKSQKCIQCSTPKSQLDSTAVVGPNQEDSPSKSASTTTTNINNSSSSCESNDQSNDSSNSSLDQPSERIKLNNNLNVINNVNSDSSSDKETDCESKVNSKVKSIKPSTSSRESNCDSLNNSLNNSLNSSLNSLNNDHHTNTDKLIDNLQANKWNCTSCTYLNWPKSQKCVICQQPKQASSSLNNLTSAINSTSCSTATTIINESSLCSGGVKSQPTATVTSNSIEDKRNTPSPTNTTTSQHHRNRLNMSNLNNVNTIINYNHLNNRRKNREQYIDWIWLEACIGVLNADPQPVLIYLNNGGDLTRQLSMIEVNFLNKQGLLGYSLVHLAIRFKRSEILEILLENRSPNRAKRVPCQISNYGQEVRKIFSANLKQAGKSDFPCYFVADFYTFALPQDILELSPSVQECLFEELLDKEVQNELEESSIINWSLEINVTLGSRLYALWNRSKGDCLLDSVLQATYGVFDKDNRLRRALADSLNDASHTLFVRFKEAENLKVSHQLPYTIDKMQFNWEDEWAVILSIAGCPNSGLEQFHIFVLSHILRRPILVYGVEFFKNYRGETLSLAGFKGVYLPLHLDPKFCSKSPIALSYTKGHFTALVPMEGMMMNCVMNCICENGQVNNDCTNCTNCVVLGAESDSLVKSNFDSDCCYLPLVTFERELLPLQFLVKSELGKQEEIMRQYLDCCVTEEGILVAKQKLQIKKPFPMQQMINEWIDFYRIPSVNCNTSVNEQSNSVPKSTNDTSKLNPYISADEDSD